MSAAVKIAVTTAEKKIAWANVLARWRDEDWHLVLTWHGAHAAPKHTRGAVASVRVLDTRCGLFGAEERFGVHREWCLVRKNEVEDARRWMF